MNRLFTFGCSFTHYHWPTWADILGKEFAYHGNWGQSGGGNLFIFNSLNECICKNNLTSDDTVVVMWSNIFRNDAYNKNQWKLRGNMYGNMYNRKYPMDMSFDERGVLIRDLAFVNAAKMMLEKLNIKHYFLSMVPIVNLDQYTNVSIQDNDVTSLYSECIEFIRPSIFEVVFNHSWYSRKLLPQDLSHCNGKTRFDSHASTLEHLEYLDKVLPEIAISEDTRCWVTRVQEHITQNSNGVKIDNDYRPWVWSFGDLFEWKLVDRL